MASPSPQPPTRSIHRENRSSIYVTKSRFDEKLERELLPSDLVEGCKIPDTVADDVLHKLRCDYHNIDELFDVDKLLPHLEKRYLVTQHDSHQIKCQSAQAAKGQLLFNAVKSKGQRSTRLSLLYKSIYDSHEAEFGHGKHYDALGILAKEAWSACRIPEHKQEKYSATDVDRLIEKLLARHKSGVHQTTVEDLCQKWCAENPAGRIEDLVTRFLCTDGHGHLVSELFPTCFSNSPSVWHFFHRLGDTWPQFARFLGYTEEQVASITEQSRHNSDLQIRCFLRAFQMPDIGSKTESVLMQANEIALKCGYKVHNIAAIEVQQDKESMASNPQVYNYQQVINYNFNPIIASPQGQMPYWQRRQLMHQFQNYLRDTQGIVGQLPEKVEESGIDPLDRSIEVLSTTSEESLETTSIDSDCQMEPEKEMREGGHVPKPKPKHLSLYRCAQRTIDQLPEKVEEQNTNPLYRHSSLLGVRRRLSIASEMGVNCDTSIFSSRVLQSKGKCETNRPILKDLQEIVSQLPCVELSKEQVSCLTMNLELQEEGLSKDQMNLRSICHRWMSKYPNECCLEDLVQALICTHRLGRYVSGITSVCNPPDVQFFFRGLCERWHEFATFLGYSKSELDFKGSEQQQIDRFLVDFRMPDCGARNTKFLHRALCKAGFQSPTKARTCNWDREQNPHNILRGTDAQVFNNEGLVHSESTADETKSSEQEKEEMEEEKEEEKEVEKEKEEEKESAPAHERMQVEDKNLMPPKEKEDLIFGQKYSEKYTKNLKKSSTLHIGWSDQNDKAVLMKTLSEDIEAWILKQEVPVLLKGQGFFVLMMSQKRQQMQSVEQQLQDVKQELQDVKQELQQTRQESRQQLQDVKQELMQELQQTRQELASLKEKSTAAERPTLEPASIPVTHRAARSLSAAYATKPSRIPIPRRVLSGQQTTSQVTPLSAATAKACSRVQPIAKKMPKTLLHSLANPNGTEYRLHVLSPFNSLLPAQAVFIFVTISLSLESQRRFEGSLRASHSYMKFDPSKGRLVKFSRGGRARFHIRVLNFAPFEIEAKEGIEEITKEEVEELPPSDHFIRYQVIPLQENVSTQRVRLALTANGIEGVTPPDVKLKAIPVTIQFNIPPQPTISQQAGDRAEMKRETDDNLRIISREIAPEVGNKWYEVGRELGLSEDELRTLQQKHPQNVTERFYYMLKKRAKQGNLHWRMLYDALRSDAVKQYETADKLQLLLNI